MSNAKRKQDLIARVNEQRAWVDEHGGTLAGYVANYHGVHGRTVENAMAIYKADKAELEKLEWMLGLTIHSIKGVRR